MPQTLPPPPHHPAQTFPPTPVCPRQPPSWQPACPQQLPARPVRSCRCPPGSLLHRHCPGSLSDSITVHLLLRDPSPSPGAGTRLSGAPLGQPFATTEGEPGGFWCPPPAPSASPAGIKPGSGSQAFCSLIPAKAEGIQKMSDGVKALDELAEILRTSPSPHSA